MWVGIQMQKKVGGEAMVGLYGVKWFCLQQLFLVNVSRLVNITELFLQQMRVAKTNSVMYINDIKDSNIAGLVVWHHSEFFL